MNNSWRRLLGLLAIMSVVQGCSAKTLVDNPNILTFSDKTDKVMVVAHRACWLQAPENSLKAIEKCIRLGVDMVEIDVRRTKDGQLILMHDETVDRTTNGTGRVSEMTLAEINQLRLKSYGGGKKAYITEHSVPTLQEALALAKGKVLVNLDAKGEVRDQAYLEAKKIGSEGEMVIKTVLRSPTDGAQLKQSVFLGNTYFMPIVNEKYGDLAAMINGLSDIPSVAYEVIYQTETGLSGACDAAQRQQVRCWVNTLWEELSPGHSDDRNLTDPDAHWGALIKRGVNMIQTDRPQLLVNYLESKGLH